MSNALNDWMRAPWMYPNVLRFRIWRMSPIDGVELWVAAPYARRGMPKVQQTLDNQPYHMLPGTGRRQIEMPQFAILAATWREAIECATKGKQPRPLELVYPEYCGLKSEIGA